MKDFNVCDHPLSDIVIAGDAVHPLPSSFHSLLQTIADLMVLLPMGSPIQQMAVRCWGLRFATSDHSFLHRSQVRKKSQINLFSNALNVHIEL